MTLRTKPWGEPAHPSVVRLYEDLIQVYRAIKAVQPDVDKAFDRVSSQIGFVVTTTIPVRAEVADKSAVKTFDLDGDAIRNTLFGKEFQPLIEQLRGRIFANVSPGAYRFYLPWYDALLLQLQYEIMEPAQVLVSLINVLTQPSQTPAVAQAAAVAPEVQEPAHWFDPRITLPVEDAVTISAIDIVYPDLHLAERISANRMAVRRIAAHVKEPAHFVRPDVREPAHFLQSLVRPEVREPAHFSSLGSREALLSELRTIIQKLGV